MDIKSAISAFESDRELYLDELMDFLRLATISAQSAHQGDIEACAAWVRAQLEAGGLEAEIVPTGGHPAVIADSGPTASGNHRPTLLFYGHYDVQPEGDASLWTSPPFEPTVRDGAIFARGSADDKGQVMTHLAAIRSLKQAGLTLPVRLKFLVEGEEEIGSPNLAGLVQRLRDRLACDYVVISDTSKADAVTPALAYATRGLVYKEVIVEGPSHDLHSGIYGGSVANPANALARIIATLHDPNNRVTIPGFYDAVLSLSPEERQRMARQGPTDESLLAATGSPMPWGEAGFGNAERIGARPTLDVNGIVGGYTGTGSSTIIPSKARAKISMRLVPNQNAETIARAFDEAVRSACPPCVRVTIESHTACDAYVATLDSSAMKAAFEALEQTFGTPPVLTREGGTLPILPMFKRILGADSIMLGFADPNCNLHSPNEFFHISDFENGVRCILRFLGRMAATPK